MKRKKRKTVHALTSSPSYSFQQTGNPEKDLKECHVLEQEWELQKRILEAEVENLRDKCEDLTRECGLMEKTVCLASVEKTAMEDQIRAQREMVETERDVLEKMRECHNELKENHGFMKKKLSVAVSEKLELIKCVMENEEELKQERNATALLKKEVEDLMHSRVEFEEKMKEKCDALEEESELKTWVYEEEVEVLVVESGVVEGMLSLAYAEKRVMEDEIRTKGEILENQNEVLEGFKEEMEKMRESHNQDLERIHNLMQQKLTVSVSEKLVLEKELQQSRIQNEEARKELKGELEKARETYEKELKQQRDSAALVKKEVANLIHSRVEFEEKMKEKYGVLEKEGELKRKVLEEEVESLKEKCEELKKETGLMKYTISMACEEKRMMEDEMRTQRELLENQNDVLHKGFKGELEKMRKYHDEELDLMKRKLSWSVIEKLQLEKELKESRTQNEEARKELEGELVKVREICEIELQRVRDSSENMLNVANLDKMNLEEELSKSKMCLEERIQLLEGDNLVLSKKLELHTKSFRNITEQLKQVYDSAISDIVRATELLGNGSNAEKRGCPFLENEPKVGANNLGLKCKRRRILNENEDNGIDHCSNNSGVDSHVISSGKDEDAGCQTEKKNTWRQPADMLCAFKNDPELCMDYVCALYRQHISARNVSNKELLSGIDIVSATAVVKYLADNDPKNKLSRSLLEVQQDCPRVLEACFKLANQYKEQIFEMYQKKLDLLLRAKP